MPKTTHGIPERRIITQTVANATVQKDIAHGPCTLLSVHHKNAQAADHYVHIYDDLNPSMAADGTSEDVKLFCRDSSDEDGKSGFLINPSTGGLPIKNGLSFGVSSDISGATAPTGNSELSFVVVIP